MIFDLLEEELAGAAERLGVSPEKYVEARIQAAKERLPIETIVARQREAEAAAARKAAAEVEAAQAKRLETLGAEMAATRERLGKLGGD